MPSRLRANARNGNVLIPFAARARRSRQAFVVLAWKGILPVARIGYPGVIPILTESLSDHEQLR
jgi:hypothetical protein